MTDIVERFRYRVDNYTAHYSTSDHDLDKLIYNHLRKVEARLAALEGAIDEAERSLPGGQALAKALREHAADLEPTEAFLQKVRAL